MKRQPIAFDIEAVPEGIKPYLKNAHILDSSCSEHAKTLFVKGTSDSTYLKISHKGSLEREFHMTSFLNSHQLAPSVIAFETC